MKKKVLCGLLSTAMVATMLMGCSTAYFPRENGRSIL